MFPFLWLKKIGHLRKYYKSFYDKSVLKNCFSSIILQYLEYCAPIWFTVADSHLQQLDQNLNAVEFLISDIKATVWHCSRLLFKISKNSIHSLHASFPELYQLACVNRHTVKGIVPANFIYG